MQTALCCPRILLAATALLAAACGSAHAITDNFTDATNWGTPMSQDGNLSVGAGRMNYTSSTTLTRTGGAAIPRKAPLLPTTRDWSMKVDAHLDPFVLTQMEQFSDVFLGFGKTGNWKNNHVTFEFGRGWWDSYNDDHKGYYIADDVRINGTSINDTLENPLVEAWGLTSADVSLRMDYRAADHTITYYFDSDGAANGYNWVAQGTASLASGTYNMNIKDTDTFTVLLVGSSGYQNVASGQAYLSNLEITLEQGTPVITWTNPAPITYGTPLSANQLNARANVPGKFTYTPALGTKLAAGSQTLNVTFTPTDVTNYCSASKSVPLTVNKATAKVTVTGLSQAYNGQPRTVGVTTVPAGLHVDVTYNGSPDAPVNVGSYPITATVVDDNYIGSASPTLSITKGAQTITFPAPPALRNGDPDYLLPASASSGLTVSYVSSAPLIASIVDGNKLHIMGAGKVTITTSQAGDADWNAARPVAKNLTIGKRSQTIDFPTLADHTMGDADFLPGASASSGLTVTYTSSAPKVATIVAGKIHLVGKGPVVITASQACDPNWDVATPVKQTLTVAAGTQTITFPPLAEKGYGDPDFTPGATATSGLTVSYVSSNLEVATIVAGKIHIKGIGTSTITANQAGNANWGPATAATQELTVIKGTPVITWVNPAPITYGTALSATQLNAKANVAGAGVYTPVLGTKLPVGEQTLTVVLTPKDTAHYNTATKSVTLTVNKAAATVTLTGLSQSYNGQARPITAATVPAGLNVNITYNGSPDAPTNVGSYPVVATVNDPNATGTKSGTLIIGKGNQTISFASLPAMQVGDADRALTASAASGLPVSYASSTPTVATIVDGNKLHAVATGSTFITATQVGDANWNPALAVKQLLTVPSPPPPPAPTGFALIPAGIFQMGNALSASEGYTNELPVHTVTVSAFYMAKYLVTKADWDTVRTWGLAHGYTDLNNGAGKATNHPVLMITWYDMMKWCNTRSEMDGLTPCYTLGGEVYRTSDDDAVVCNWSTNGYRLPTEAEWEKAARGGLDEKRFPWGDTISQSQANYCVYSVTGTTNYYSYDVTPCPGYAVNINSHPTYSTGDYPYTSPVGSFAPNGYGLYDMAGNVLEWCWDWWESYPSTAQIDPRGAASGSYRVLRGGSWSDVARYCRVAYRNYGGPATPGNKIGFRVARSSAP